MYRHQDFLGVGQSTISKQLEPLSDDWEDTIINSLPDYQHNFAVRNSIRSLSVRKLRLIRKATGSNDGLQLAERAVERDLIVQNLSIERSVWTIALANEPRPAMAR